MALSKSFPTLVKTVPNPLRRSMIRHLHEFMNACSVVAIRFREGFDEHESDGVKRGRCPASLQQALAGRQLTCWPIPGEKDRA